MRDKMSDAQVIEQVLEGDTGAFEILILNLLFTISSLSSIAVLHSFSI